MRKMLVGLVAVICVSPALATDQDFLALQEQVSGYLSKGRGSQREVHKESQKVFSDQAEPPTSFSEGWLSNVSPFSSASWSFSDFPQRLWGSASREEAKSDQGQEGDLGEWVLIENIYSFHSMNALSSEVLGNAIYMEHRERFGDILKVIVAINSGKSGPALLEVGALLRVNSYELIRLSYPNDQMFHGQIMIEKGVIDMNDSKSVQNTVLDALKKGGVIPSAATLINESRKG